MPPRAQPAATSHALADALGLGALAATATSPNRLAWADADGHALLYRANCLELLDRIIERHPDGFFDMIFADPPYFLSNGGVTCHGGKMVKVDKGAWDRSQARLNSWL